MDKPKDDRSLEVKVVAAVFLAIASVTVVLRCYVRFFLVKAFGWDDGAMVIALVFLLSFESLENANDGSYGTACSPDA
jgi:hypothetical protein